MTYPLILRIILISAFLFCLAPAAWPQVPTPDSVHAAKCVPALDSLYLIPCGPAIGSFTSSAHVTVSDTLAGWARVTVEGWVPAATALRYGPISSGGAARAIKNEKKSQPTEQCAAFTKSGNRCTRNALPGSNYCWQHDPSRKRSKP